MGFLDVAGKSFLVFGVANKRSVAYHIARVLESEGATVIYSVRSEARRESLTSLLAGREVHVCDTEQDEPIVALARSVAEKHSVIHGIVHSIAFANYDSFSGKFHEVKRRDFLQCVSVSCYSLIAIANAFRGMLDKAASVVTISISTTRMAVESYGYMAPAKAALDSSVAFLAKSFSAFSEVRFNAVSAGLLKTSASAGIPGYVDHYLFAEQAIPRKRAVSTEEVANLAAFLLSERSRDQRPASVDARGWESLLDPTIVKHTVGGVWADEGERRQLTEGRCPMRLRAYAENAGSQDAQRQRVSGLPPCQGGIEGGRIVERRSVHSSPCPGGHSADRRTADAAASPATAGLCPTCASSECRTIRRAAGRLDTRPRRSPAAERRLALVYIPQTPMGRRRRRPNAGRD